MGFSSFDWNRFWDFMYWVVKLNTLIEKSNQDSLILRTVISRDSIAVIFIYCVEIKWIVKVVNFFIALNFWLSLIYTLQQSKNPLSICHCTGGMSGILNHGLGTWALRSYFKLFCNVTTVSSYACSCIQKEINLQLSDC